MANISVLIQNQIQKFTFMKSSNIIFVALLMGFYGAVVQQTWPFSAGAAAMPRAYISKAVPSFLLKKAKPYR